MANPGRTMPTPTGTATKQLPDFISSPGQASLFVAFLEDYRDVMRERSGGNPSRFDAIHQGLVTVAAEQLGKLHEAS